MKRIALKVAGLGTAGLLVMASAARAGEPNKDQSTGSSSTTDSAATAAKSPTSSTYPDAVYTNDVVKKVDMSKHELTLASSGKTVQLSDDCKVMMNGKSASMSEVKEGEPIRAAMTGKGDAAKIVEIWVIQPGGASKSTGSSGK